MWKFTHYLRTFIFRGEWSFKNYNLHQIKTGFWQRWTHWDMSVNGMRCFPHWNMMVIVFSILWYPSRHNDHFNWHGKNVVFYCERVLCWDTIKVKHEDKKCQCITSKCYIIFSQCGNNTLSKCTLGRLDISTGQTGLNQRPLRQGLLEEDLQIQDSNPKITTAILLQPHHVCPIYVFGEKCDRYHK